MAINLSKKDTLQLIFENNKLNNFENKYIYTTRYPWNCLSCSSQIFISYKQFSIVAIFCNNCKHKAFGTKSPDLKLVYSQYMRRVKEKQLQIIEKYIN